MAAYDLPPERLERWLERWAERHGGVTGAVAEPDTVTYTAADGATVACAPPFPPLAAATGDEAAPFAPLDPATGDEAAPFAPLLDHVRRRRTVGVLLVRLGGFGVGIFDGADLRVSKVGSRLVHGRHRAGGSSANRFARRRSNQARSALDAATETAVAILAGPARGGDLDAVVRGGDRRALTEVFEDPRLAGVLGLAVERIIDVPDPRLKVLRAAPGQFLATRVVPDETA